MAVVSGRPPLGDVGGPRLRLVIGQGGEPWSAQCVVPAGGQEVNVPEERVQRVRVSGVLVDPQKRREVGPEIALHVAGGAPPAFDGPSADGKSSGRLISGGNVKGELPLDVLDVASQGRDPRISSGHRPGPSFMNGTTSRKVRGHNGHSLRRLDLLPICGRRQVDRRGGVHLGNAPGESQGRCRGGVVSEGGSEGGGHICPYCVRYSKPGFRWTP